MAIVMNNTFIIPTLLFNTRSTLSFGANAGNVFIYVVRCKKGRDEGNHIYQKALVLQCLFGIILSSNYTKNIRFILLEKTMKSYLDIVRHVLGHGVHKTNKTNVNTLTVAGLMFEHK